MKTQFTRVSRNRKVGPIPTTVTSAKACPESCPLKNAGCYADGGPTAMNWQKVSAGERGDDWAAFLENVKSKIMKRGLWRHNVAGDLISDGVTIDAKKLRQLAQANKGKRGFTYTHHDVFNNPVNKKAIRAANAAGFTVNLSGNNPAHADQLADENAGPVVTLLPEEYGRAKNNGVFKESLRKYKKRLSKLSKQTPAGRPITVCPATFLDEMDCAACGLCQNQNRAAIVGFPAHGFRAKKADAIARK
jgi:hypothetical protein